MPKNIQIRIEPRHYPNAAHGFQFEWLWSVTLPNGKKRWAGAVRLFTIEEVMSCRKLRRWAERNQS